MEEVLRRARAESWSERWVREYVARRRRTREPPPRRCRRCPARDVRLCWGRGSRPPNFERRRERREREGGVRWLKNKSGAPGARKSRESRAARPPVSLFGSCRVNAPERGNEWWCPRRIIPGGARGRSREHGRTFPMVSVARLCRWTNRFSSSWSQPWAEGCGEGAGKRRVRRRDRRPCGTPRI